MFNKNDKNTMNELIEENKRLLANIEELQKTLNEVANSNGACIIKQLPDGVIELNGEPIDKDTPVDYYNSASATYGELTMYRVAKEAFARDEKKLINIHLEECDKYKMQIEDLKDNIDKLKTHITWQDEHIDKINNELSDSSMTINTLQNSLEKQAIENESDRNILINRYNSMIDALEEDIKTWKARYLNLNNVSLDGTIITKYGEVSNKTIKE